MQNTAANWSLQQPLARGWRGTERTLRAMAWFARRDAGSQELRDIALRIIGHVPGHDFQSEINALFFFARNLRYRRDPVAVERVQDALRTIQFGTGDCDDKAVLLASLLATVGHRSRFVVTGPAVGKWAHVFLEAQTKRGWLPLDPTPERAYPGWEQSAPAKAVFEIWPKVTSLRVVRMPRSKVCENLKRQVGTVPAASFSPRPSPEITAYLSGQTPCQCGTYFYELPDEYDLGADKYEWKKISADKCELKKKSCGFWCKIGGAFKTIGKWALVVAPIALAPFTAGGSLALTGATGTALTVSAAAASAAGALVTSRHTAGLPKDAQIQEPEGECKAILQREAEAEARRIAEEEAAKAAAIAKQQAELQAQQTAAIVAAVTKQQAQQGFNVSSLTSNPVLLAGLILGGAVLLSRN